MSENNKCIDGVNVMEVCELLEKAVCFLRYNGMIDEWLEDQDLDPSEEAKERFCIYTKEDEERLWAVIDHELDIADDEELAKELRSFDESDLFEEEDF